MKEKDILLDRKPRCRGRGINQERGGLSKDTIQ